MVQILSHLIQRLTFPSEFVIRRERVWTNFAVVAELLGEKHWKLFEVSCCFYYSGTNARLPPRHTLHPLHTPTHSILQHTPYFNKPHTTSPPSALPPHPTLRRHPRRPPLLKLILIRPPHSHIRLHLLMRPHSLMVPDHPRVRLDHAAEDHGRHLNVPAARQSAGTRMRVSEWWCYVLNCTVRPRYRGEMAYATPPATAKKAPHCQQSVRVSERLEQQIAKGPLLRFRKTISLAQLQVRTRLQAQKSMT